jgi:hypothetical protein
MNRALRILFLTLLACALTAGLVWAAPPYQPASTAPSPTGTGVGPKPTLAWTGGDADAPDKIVYDMDIWVNARPAWDNPSHHPNWPDGFFQQTQISWHGRKAVTGSAHNGNPAFVIKWPVPLYHQLPPNNTYHWTVTATSEKDKATSETYSFTTDTYPYIMCLTPDLARPTYIIEICGVNFGAEPGLVKLNTQWIGGGWGKVFTWEDDHIVIWLPNYTQWYDWLPGVIKVQVRSADGHVSNVAGLNVTYGGGGVL